MVDFATKKAIEHENDGDAKCNWGARYSQQMIDKGTGELGSKRTSGDHLKYIIFENTLKSPGNLRRLVVTHTPVENHQLILVWRTLKEVK